MVRLTVTHLQEHELDAAFPLVRAAAPGLTPERWRAHGRALIAGEGGVLAVFADPWSPLGVAAWTIEESLRHGRTLRADPFVTFELARGTPARAALCEALEIQARARGCECLCIAAGRGYADADPGKAQGWSALGFALDTVTFMLPLAWEAATQPLAKAG